MVPVTMERFRLRRVGEEGARWLAETLSRHGERLGTAAEVTEAGTLRLVWEPV